MPNWLKCTMFFNQEQNSWTESYYFNGISQTLQPYMAGSNSLAVALATQRMSISGSQTYCPYVRLSLYQSPGISARLVVPNNGQPGVNGYDGQGIRGSMPSASDPAVLADSDFKDSAYLANFADITNGSRKVTYIRGVADDSIIKGGQFSPTIPQLNLINTYLKWLSGVGGTAYLPITAQPNPGTAGSAFGWLHDTGLIKASITTVVPNQADQTVVINLGLNNGGTPGLTSVPGSVGPPPIVATPGPAVGSIVQLAVRKVQGWPQLNGVRNFKVISPSSIQSVDRIGPLPVSSLEGAYVRYSPKTFIAIGQGIVSRVVERRAGRPLYNSPGRR